MSDRVKMITDRLNAGLSPIKLEIQDQSAQHAGHAGARDGGGHFTIKIVSEQFAGMSRIERHRMVYRLLSDAMETDIHALSIKALLPNEL